jgi:hypothetical protein
MSDVASLWEQVKSLYSSLETELTKNTQKDNLKAGTRARKVASELTKVLKTLRKSSQEKDKAVKAARTAALRAAGVPAKVFPGRTKKSQ